MIIKSSFHYTTMITEMMRTCVLFKFSRKSPFSLGFSFLPFLTIITYIFPSLVATNLQWKVHVHATNNKGSISVAFSLGCCNHKIMHIMCKGDHSSLMESKPWWLDYEIMQFFIWVPHFEDCSQGRCYSKTMELGIQFSSWSHILRIVHKVGVSLRLWN